MSVLERVFFVYADDVLYWFGFLCVLVTCWFCFVAAVHSLTKDGR